MIEAESLVKSFGAKLALRGMSFSVAEGQIHGLLGPNGAGKTTTTRILAALLRPDEGRAWVAGFDVNEHPEQVRAAIGILTEVPGLYERLSAYEYLDFFAQVYGMRADRRRARIEELLRLLDLWETRKQRLRTYSKGMKQKVAIARALIHEPRVLFFDEPTAALDPEAAKTVRDHLLMLMKQERRTVLLCTHNLAEAERLCTRLSIVQDGRVIVEGAPDELRAAVRQSMRLTLREVRPSYVGIVQAMEEIEDVSAVDGSIAYSTRDAARVNPRIIQEMVAAGAEVVSLQVDTVALEDAYLHVMRRAADGAGTTRNPA